MAEKVDIIELSKKEAHRLNLLEYIANPENPVLSRTNLARDVLNITPQAMYKLFNGDEMSNIEYEALNKRRARYGLKLGMVDKALFEKAIDDKDVKAIELVYKRFENWNPNQKIEISTSGNITNALSELSKRLPD